MVIECVALGHAGSLGSSEQASKTITIVKMPSVRSVSSGFAHHERPAAAAAAAAV